MMPKRLRSEWYVPPIATTNLQADCISFRFAQLQRVGRTGRKRDGYVHVLLSEIREEANWDKAQDTYGELQKCIVRGDQLELYGDVLRLLPDHLRPQVLEKKMDIEEYVREELGKRKKPPPELEDGEPPAKGKKRKRNDDADRNVPPGASKGFVSVADLIVKKKKKTKTRKFDHTLAEDDSTDMELQTNLMDTGRSISASAADKPKRKNKASLRKTRTEPEKKQATGSVRKKDKAKESESLGQFSRKEKDSSDDMDIERYATSMRSLP